MKLLKKMSALLVAVVMMAVTVVPALADEVKVDWSSTGGTSTRDLVAYQIFEGTLNETVNESTLGDIKWAGLFETNQENNSVQTTFIQLINDTLDDDAKLGANSTASEVAAVITQTNAEQVAKAAENALKMNSNYKLSGTHLTDQAKDLPKGYYVILDETDTLTDGEFYNPAVLQVVGDTTISPKTNTIEFGKEVQDGENGANNGDWGESADYSIGDQVPFRLYAKIPNATTLSHYTNYKLVITDEASNGLTMPTQDDVNVYYSAKKDGTDKTEFTRGDVKIEGQELTVTFEDLKPHANIVADKYIIVEYNAILNTNAELRNENNVKITYSNKPNSDSTHTTDEKEVYVYTFRITGDKVDGQNIDTSLKGAEFIITRTNGTKKEYANVQNGKVQNWTAYGEDEDIKKIPDDGNIVSNDSGEFIINGLDVGEYELWEVQAPNGYNTPNHSFKITINATHNKDEVVIDENNKFEITLSKNDGTNDSGTTTNGTVNSTNNTSTLPIIIANNKGTTLPETGGMGTTLLYVAGGILLIGSAVLLVTKKRMGHEN